MTSMMLLCNAMFQKKGCCVSPRYLGMKASLCKFGASWGERDDWPHARCLTTLLYLLFSLSHTVWPNGVSVSLSLGEGKHGNMLVNSECLCGGAGRLVDFRQGYLISIASVSISAIEYNGCCSQPSLILASCNLARCKSTSAAIGITFDARSQRTGIKTI